MRGRPIIIPCLLALLAGGVAAADRAEEAPRWFRAELLVFAQPPGAQPEQWEATPALAYPQPARFLIDPQRVAANSREHGDAPIVLDALGRQIIPPENSESADTEHRSAAAENGQASTPPASAATPGDVGDENRAGNAATEPALPTPFVTLPATQREFRGKAAYMERRGGYRILFHETWVQPVAGKSDAVPIVLDHSGDSEQWPALQGSVSLHLSRYLHLNTRLWLNTSGSYLPGAWHMPAPPLAPPSLLLPPTVVSQPLTSARAAVPPAGTAVDATANETAVADAAMNEVAAGVTSVNASGQANGTHEPGEAGESSPRAAYPYRHAVVLQQQRRMRSGEVHYLDHPLFGAVVKLTPLTAQELAQLAAEERAAGILPPPQADSPAPARGSAATAAAESVR